MIKKLHLNVIIFTIIGTFVFALISQTHTCLFHNFLIANNISESEIENIEIMQMLAYLGASIVLFAGCGKIKNDYFIIISLIIYLISVYNLLLNQDYHLLKMHLIIIAGCNYVYYICNICKLTELYNLKKNYPLIAVFLSWALGSLGGEKLYVIIITIGIEQAITITSFIISLLIIPAFIFRSKTLNDTNNFNYYLMLKNIELQLIAGFIAAYIIMAMYWNYEVYALYEGFAIKDINTVRRFILILLGIFIVPFSLAIIYSNKYIINIFSLIIMFCSFMLMKYFSREFENNLIITSLIGMSIYAVIISNILILMDKFEGHELQVALSIYFSFGAMGTYTGLTASSKIMDVVSEEGFILSINFVIGTFLIYYIIHFFKLKLYIQKHQNF